MNRPSWFLPSYDLKRWESRTEWPLAVVAVVFLIAYSVEVLAQPRGLTYSLLEWFLRALYLAFVIDYFARLVLADPRTRWFFRHLLDLAVIAVPFLRPLRMLSLVVQVGALQKAFGDANRGRVVIYTAFSAVLLIYAGSLAELEAERLGPGRIKHFGDAVWWSVTTITTVGYGDFVPVTLVGRLIAVLLMLGGISVIGVITATVAGWIIQRVAEVDAKKQAATAAEITALRAQITKLAYTMSALGSDRGLGGGAHNYFAPSGYRGAVPRHSQHEASPTPNRFISLSRGA